MGDMLSSKQNTEMDHVLQADAVAAKGLQDTNKKNCAMPMILFVQNRHCQFQRTFYLGIEQKAR